MGQFWRCFGTDWIVCRSWANTLEEINMHEKHENKVARNSRTLRLSSVSPLFCDRDLWNNNVSGVFKLQMQGSVGKQNFILLLWGHLFTRSLGTNIIQSFEEFQVFCTTQAFPKIERRDEEKVNPKRCPKFPTEYPTLWSPQHIVSESKGWHPFSFFRIWSYSSEGTSVETYNWNIRRFLCGFLCQILAETTSKQQEGLNSVKKTENPPCLSTQIAFFHLSHTPYCILQTSEYLWLGISMRPAIRSVHSVWIANYR